MKSWNYLHSYNRDGSKNTYVELYEQPAWRELLGPIVYWLDLHKPNWMEPGTGGPASRSNGDGTCTFLWRLRLELFLCFDFHHDKRTVIETVRLDADTVRRKNVTSGDAPGTAETPVDES